MKTSRIATISTELDFGHKPPDRTTDNRQQFKHRWQQHQLTDTKMLATVLSAFPRAERLTSQTN